jgi:triacylglycerol esterase/lipase EstA (alpha/beta hydrolase family)
LALVLTALAWFLFWASQAAWGLAFIGAGVLVLIQPLALAVEFAVLPFVNRRDPAPRVRGWQLVKAWWQESITAQAVFLVRQPWREWAVPDLWPPPVPGTRAVVLVHGFFCNRALWNPWLVRLRDAGVPTLAINLEPAFGSIDDYAPQIEAAVAEAERATGRKPVLVAHSMGGLAVRAWRRAGGSVCDERVSRVITVGTPHEGTLTAFLSAATNARQMRRGSAWLEQLARSEDAGWRARFTCFYSHCDNIAVPASTGAWRDADSRHLPGWPHVAMAFAPEVWREVLRWTEGTSRSRS